MTQNSISIPSCAQTPKNPRKMSKTPPYSGLGAKPFLAPPAKADIATAILTNVIEHLVLLFCPPISTPSPPKRCGRIRRGVQSTVETAPKEAIHLCWQKTRGPLQATRQTGLYFVVHLVRNVKIFWDKLAISFRLKS